MKAKFRDGAQLYTTRMIVGTKLYTGTRVAVVESYVERKAETRYLVRADDGDKAYCYESDLSVADPLAMHNGHVECMRKSVRS